MIAIKINIGLRAIIGSNVNRNVKNQILQDTTFTIESDTIIPKSIDNKIVATAYTLSLIHI